jgi:flagellar hook assembly protein FlgD
VATSLAFGVISPFTSLRVETDPGGTTEAEEGIDQPEVSAAEIEVAGNYPNPFHDRTTLRFEVRASAPAVALVRIYDLLGRLVRVLAVPVSGPGVYEVVWDGLSNTGQPVPAGSYVYTVTRGDTVAGGVMVKIG